MEAAAMGLPIVATDIRGNRQVVADRETGVLTPVRDAPALADAVLDLARDSERCDRFGVAARQRAAAEFDQQRVIDRTLAAYDLLG
jgi:glycosyltransferase involved in cell wall biosynthesis